MNRPETRSDLLSCALRAPSRDRLALTASLLSLALAAGTARADDLKVAAPTPTRALVASQAAPKPAKQQSPDPIVGLDLLGGTALSSSGRAGIFDLGVTGGAAFRWSHVPLALGPVATIGVELTLSKDRGAPFWVFAGTGVDFRAGERDSVMFESAAFAYFQNGDHPVPGYASKNRFGLASELGLNFLDYVGVIARTSLLAAPYGGAPVEARAVVGLRLALRSLAAMRFMRF